MRTILETVKTVLPDCCNSKDTGWDSVPRWAPDLFAAMATITERSGLYSDRAFTSAWDDCCVCGAPYRDEVLSLGKDWRDSGDPPKKIQDYWTELIRDHQEARIDDIGDATTPWRQLVFKLLTIADEACAGVGFPPRKKNRSYIEFCWYGPNPAAPIIQASGTESVERASIVRRQLR